MADDIRPPEIDPQLLEEARAKGVDVESLIDRTLRHEIANKLDPEAARRVAAALVEDYNTRYDRDGAWIEAWRNWE
jgi:post-segregation antitoxin (ccd killing protein)